MYSANIHFYIFFPYIFFRKDIKIKGLRHIDEVIHDIIAELTNAKKEIDEVIHNRTAERLIQRRLIRGTDIGMACICIMRKWCKTDAGNHFSNGAKWISVMSTCLKLDAGEMRS
ncbi:uncharacterized protein LOC108214780 isoform X3 [Daucus carota subsp. sativus]|uniref:uncharacterized protein LOC108214780 isoform X3 n=1 Tax=Daucus carota subsp. sativus TaxID=79200 RepID=UPI0030832AD5